MRRHRFAQRCLVALISTGLLLGVAAPAAAEADPGLDAWKSGAHDAIVARVRALYVAGVIVDRSPFMGAHRQERLEALRTVGRELWALDGEIQADTTVAEARADALRIGTDFRVYVLVLPATYLTRAADLVTNKLVPEHERLASRLQDAITSHDRADLQPLVDDMTAKIAAASESAAPLPDQLATFTAAQWNADHELLVPARDAMESASDDLRAARDDARKIVEALKV